MEPIRTPRRYAPIPRAHSRELLPYIAAVLALMLIAFGAVRLHESGWRLSIDQTTDEDAQAAKIIYACYDGQTGRLLYEQSEPCPSAAASATKPARAAPDFEAAAPVARAPAPAPAYRPNPNQALLDAADARYRREVQSAQRAGDGQDRQRSATQLAATAAAAEQSQQCRWICDSLSRLRNQMRNPYDAQQSVYFHERQNQLFKQMNDSGCRACGH